MRSSKENLFYTKDMVSLESRNLNFDVADDPFYFDIVNYLMSDQKILGVEDYSHGSFHSILPFAPHNIKPRRGLDKCEAKAECRFAFRTKTQLEIMDDGYKWRKYGKKMVKNSSNPRNYFKCSSGGCNVKKRVERDDLDSSYVITTYQGIHNHISPT